jgi:hypothetical protein
LSIRLPQNTSRLCSASKKGKVFVVGGSISGTFDIEKQEWEDIPAASVTILKTSYPIHIAIKTCPRQVSDAGCMIDTDEFGSSYLYVVGGSVNKVRRLNVDSGRDWEAGGRLTIDQQRSNRPVVSLTAKKVLYTIKF